MSKCLKDQPVGHGARYTWPFHVRHYELMPAGIARPEVYLNWLEEAGLVASSHAGYPVERYQAIGAFWWAYRFRLEWYGPAVYGEALEATTWISHFRRIRALREYEIRRVADQGLVFAAQADWAFVNVSTGQPARVPEDMETCFPPSGVEALQSLPWSWHAAGAGSGPFETRRAVQYHELDSMGHVNHAFYLAWLADGLQEHVNSCEAGQNVDVLPERFDIEYLRSARAGDLVTVASRLLDWDGAQGCWEHEIRLVGVGEVVVRAHSRCRLFSALDEALPAACLETLGGGSIG